MKRIFAALIFVLLACSAASAQGCGPSNPNCIVADRPAGDSTGAAANTKFVTAAIAAAQTAISVTCSAHQFVNVISAIGSTCAQPAFTDISGQATLAQLPSIANSTVLGNVSGGLATPVALTTAQHTTLCNVFTSSLSGCAPSSGGGTTNFLRADGTWQAVSGSGTCNVRPTNETAYTVLPADNGGCIVVTNITAVETVTLPNAATNNPFTITVMTLAGPSSSSALPANVASAGGAISNQVQVQISPYQSATFRSDGTNWNQITTVASPLEGGGGFNMPSAVSYSLATAPIGVTLDGTCTLNDVVGFDYASSLFATQQFRHTMTTGATCIRDAILDLTAQFRANTTVRNAIGADLVILSNPVQVSGTAWAFFFNQSWPFVINNPPTTTQFCSPCSTETVTVSGNGATGLETSSALLLGHSTLNLGRAPAAGDLIGTIYWCGDNTSTPCFPRYGTPFYAQIGTTILNPSPAVQTGRLDVFANTVAFNNEAQTGVAYGGVGVGTFTPKALLHLNANTLGTITGTAGTSLLLTAADGAASNVEIKAPAAPSFIGTTYNGTGASPTAVTTANFLTQMTGAGFNSSTFALGGSVQIRPAGTWTTSDQRSFIAFNTTPNSATTPAEAGRFQPSGALSVGTTIDPGVGSIRVLNALSAGNNAGAGGSLILAGSSSGGVTQVVPAAAGTPTVTWGSNSGTPAVSASAPLTITAATGNITITSPLPTANGGTNTDVGAAWTSFSGTAAITCGTATFTTNSARFKQLGKVTFISIDFTFTALGTCTNSATFTMPVTSQGSFYFGGRESGGINGGIAQCTNTASSATAQCSKNLAANFVNGERYIFQGSIETN